MSSPNYNISYRFDHHFCESKVYPNRPEYINSISSIFMVFIPLLYEFPKMISFRRVIILIMFNGLASAYYHYNLSWMGKQMNEITMIFIIHIGLSQLLNILNYRKKIIYYFNDIYIIFMIAINTFPMLDILFPILFLFPLIELLILIFLLKKFLIRLDIRPIFIAIFGGFCWILSELLCNKYLYFGHAIWHILFPLGIIKLINNIDNASRAAPFFLNNDL